MGVLLALGAALAYGLSDFIGGLASRRTSAWAVAFVAAVGSLVGAVALAVAVPGDATRDGPGLGCAGRDRQRHRRRLPLPRVRRGPDGRGGPGVRRGCRAAARRGGREHRGRPSALVWIGIVAAVPGIWLVSREPERDGGLAAGLVDGVLAGAGFGLLFAAMGQVPEEAGWWPTAVTQAVALLAVALTATALRVSWVPRHATELWGLLAGLLATTAVVCFLLATQTGMLTIAAVVTSLYPAFTILLAATVLHERIHGLQGLGLACCGVAVALVAAG